MAIVQDPATSARAHDAGRGDRRDVGRRHPAARGDPGVPLRPLRRGRPVSERRANILLVDDREENLLALEAILEPLGHRLVSVTSGDGGAEGAAARRLRVHPARRPDAGARRVRARELIKQRERSQHIPIIFVTALSKEEQHVYRGYSAGAVDYIFKPIDPTILRSKVVGLRRAVGEDAAAAGAGRAAARAGARRARARERGALPPARRRDAADRLDVGRRRQRDVFQPPLVRLHRHVARRGRPERLALGRPPRRPARRGRAGASRRSRAASRSRSSTASAASDGEYRWHLGRAVPIRDADGAIAFWVGTATDIHDRKLIEDQRTFIVTASDALVPVARLPGDAHRRSRSSQRTATLADWCAVHVVEADGSALRGRGRARRSGEADARPGAAGALSARPRRADRSRRRDPHRRAGARAGDHRRS